MKRCSALLAFLLLSLSATAQLGEEKEPEILTIGGGVGVLSFFGEMTQESDVSTFTNMRTGYHFSLERRLGNFFGVGLTGNMGSLAHVQRSSEIGLNRNFESKIMQFGVNATFHFDNDVMINRQSMFTPYLSAGFGYMKFDPYGDLKDANGNDYHYWSDGSIKDLAENDDNADSAVHLVRDYTFESQLNDSTTSYDRNTFAIPLTFGLKWKFSQQVHGRFFASYNLTMSDWVDNVSDDAKNDAYLYTGFALHYTIKKPDPSKKQKKDLYKDVDFASLEKADMDKDGVDDFNDECPDTPKGIKVNGKGCPLDDDKDGVPNHIDREPNSAKGVAVDSYGITVDDMYLARQAAARDSVKTIRTQAFADNPNAATLANIDQSLAKTNPTNDGTTSNSANPLPPHIIEADLNKDGIIQSTEITATIDMFFEGTTNFTVAGIQDLIDFFFEQ